MNYPLARIGALKILSKQNKAFIRNIFLSPSRVLDALELDDVVNTVGQSPIKMPVYSLDAAKSPYCKLGAMAALDVFGQSGAARHHIGDYYHARIGSVRECCVLIALDGHRKPVGYATWKVEALISSH